MTDLERTAYDAAHAAAVVFRAGGREALRIWGRDPAQMLLGITTGRIPEARGGNAKSPLEAPLKGDWAHSAILTPKGRMVSDLRIFSLPEVEDAETDRAEGATPTGTAFVLDLPAAGVEPVREHLKRVLPPRFARAEPWAWTPWVVVGPHAAAMLAKALGISAEVVAGMSHGELIHAFDGSVVLRTRAAVTPAFEVWSPADSAGVVADAVIEAGAATGSPVVREILRVETGQPEFGTDMGPETLLPEAGLVDRAVDHTKGCYTGQEVVVRIRDRGHVNRHLRGLMLSTAAPAPPAGAELFSDDTGKAVGKLTSVVESPTAERPLGLGYVRREVEPGGGVRVGLPVGPLAEVRRLDGDWWR